MPKTQLDKLFQERYKNLNNEQKRAVDTIEGPVMVIAGPGTGKTTILTLRIANILNKTDTPPSGILALTFTDAGVKAMRTKLREIIGSRADEIGIFTFHGFAGHVISEFSENFPHLHRSKQITDVMKESMLRQILKDKKFSKLRPIGDTDFYLSKIISAISDAKKEAWTPDYIKSFAKEEIERIKSDENSISTKGKLKGELKADALKRIEKCERTILFSDIFEEYENKKKEEKRIDFDDLIFELSEVMKKDELLLRLLQEKYLYILVDEHQDTNDSQNQIISNLANFFDNPNIFVVGDEKQAIYRFQGASVENFLKFKNLWKNMEVISLIENYRSHQDILDAVYEMIEQNYTEDEYSNLRVKLKSGSKLKKQPIDYVYSPDTFSADEYLVDELKKIEKMEPDSTVAVILRWNRDVDHVLSLCKANGIKVSAERGVDIFSAPLGILYFKVLEYLSDPTQIESLAFSLAGGLWNKKLNESALLIKKMRSGQLVNIEKEIPEIKELREFAKNSGMIDYLISIGEKSGLISGSNLSPDQVEIWRGIIDLASDIAVDAGINDPLTLISELLNYKKTAENKTVKIGIGSLDSRIQVMTAHSSKGLEFDYVFLPYSLEEYWIRPHRGSVFVMPREKETSDDIRDSRRLFYVAITRARKHVVIISPLKNNLGKDYTELRFAQELSKNNITEVSIKKINIKPKKIDSSFSSKRQELLDYSVRNIFDNGLSVTALNHFISCPSEFLYKSILKVPEAPTGSSEKGIAMHTAISLVWKDKDKSQKNIKEVLENSVKSYFDNSLLAKIDKENILDELLKDIPKVSAELESHFNQKGEVSTDRWVNRTISFGDKIPELVLHGQLDAMISTNKEVLLFDYKTRQGMSLNAIKGETKSDDGKYFRQLIFYKILLLGNSLYSDKKIEPALVFVKPDEKGRCPIISLPIEESDISMIFEYIKKLIEDIYSGKFLDDSCDDPKCVWCAVKKRYLASE